MPKDNRKIHSGVRHGGRVYGEGMEDELAAAVGQEGLERLTQCGAISGNWASSAPAAPVEDEEVAETDAEVDEVEEAEEEEEAPAAASAKKAAAKKPASKAAKKK